MALFSKKTAADIFRIVQKMDEEERRELERMLTEDEDKATDGVDAEEAETEEVEETSEAETAEEAETEKELATESEETASDTPEHPDAREDANQIETLIAPLRQELDLLRKEIETLKGEPREVKDDEKSKLDILARRFTN